MKILIACEFSGTVRDAIEDYLDLLEDEEFINSTIDEEEE